MPEQRIYAHGEEPDVEVLVDGTWHPGELRSWRHTDQGWVGMVRWHRGPGDNLLESFPADRIREAES